MKKYTYKDLLDIMAKLRSPGGCPWDREQDHKSLKRYLIEEAYEVLEAIDEENPAKLCDELGDLLLQVVFHAQIARENGQFDMEDVVHGVSSKMINRHRHVFGEEEAETPEDVIRIWEEIKKEEKGQETQTKVLKGVPANLPALMRSYKVQEKAAQVGFDWDKAEDAFKKLEEEVQELKKACESKDQAEIEEEMGDLLFAAVNVARFYKVQPELALSATVNKFIKRFEYVENESAKQGKKLQDMTLEEMDALWDECKRKERGDASPGEA
ncbi:MAG TPA: nucleoside triphosphate pyrophosphohydrolase [Thermoclostridium caenicola]|uniref:nucleoside triphosphate pyrophosphohydrolase n=1 Tax=Thermoclostridium caenicola TaxID=659425 RepID=UPI002BA0A775|nr:nucleoside triphosphate pyrophosphohydrolase [Thermoclostridium caenicola]HOK42307.1 nucleoside triphosphate pyrophosphohydrolase [Thermoclostridium caenicola]HOL85281.1 nucleoside triphosphate pyrophosphohydrolase [Thermoclostridium caenicola]HPO76793.1 nucleoside triphosphate pyrophosphohydrolase [Thermoclostridium caenicola]